jgi:hypothetical protein
MRLPRRFCRSWFRLIRIVCGIHGNVRLKPDLRATIDQICSESLSAREIHNMQHRYPCGGVSRRQFLGATLAAAPSISAWQALAAQEGTGPAAKATQAGGAVLGGSKFALPGLFPGQVVEVRHPGMCRSGVRDATAIKAAMERGIKELTGATDAVDAW